MSAAVAGNQITATPQNEAMQAGAAKILTAVGIKN
jgi:hypothetical protein